MRQISICIPTWERFESVVELVDNIKFDDRIYDIQIRDDASGDGSYEKLKEYYYGQPKIKLHQNTENLGCYHNKFKVALDSITGWLILLDSDNKIDQSYLDTIFEYEWDRNVIYTPSFASPHFDFRAYEGLLITKQNVAEYIDKPLFEVMLNAANYFFHKGEWCTAVSNDVDPITSDSIKRCYDWLVKGKEIYVTPNLTYNHVIHAKSHYQNFNHLTPAGLHQQILNNIRELR